MVCFLFHEERNIIDRNRWKIVPRVLDQCLAESPAFFSKDIASLEKKTSVTDFSDVIINRIVFIEDTKENGINLLKMAQEPWKEPWMFISHE